MALLFVVAGIFYVKADNLSPFVPPWQGVEVGAGGLMNVPVIQSLFGVAPVVCGWGGVITAAAIVFFAFIGFDVVATTAEETREPQRDVPLGILGSLAICTALYFAVSIVLTGMQNYRNIDPSAPRSTAFSSVGQDAIARIIGFGAALGIIVVVMILLLGQTRVAFAMARDGLLPSPFAKVHPTFRTPYVVTATVGVFVAIVASSFSISELAELVNIGTLFAFVLVSIGLVVYFGYGRSHSKVGLRERQRQTG